MTKVAPYPAIVEAVKGGFSLYFPDLPGVVSAGNTYEETLISAKESLSLHLYGMLEDNEKVPKASDASSVFQHCEQGDLVALVEPDIFAVKAKQEDKCARINITLPRSLICAIDHRAKMLHLTRSAFLQKAAREAM